MSALAEGAQTALEPAERLAFIGNAGALFSNGTIHGDAYLEILSRFASDPDPQVLSATMGELAQIRFMFGTAQNRPAFEAYVRRTFGPALDRVGFTPKAGEKDTITSLRPEILGLLGSVGRDERVAEFVREQLPLYLKDPSTLHPTLVSTVLTQSARDGDEALFEELRKRFENASLPADRSRYLAALSRFRNPVLKKKAREYALSGPVRANEMFVLLGVSETPEERDESYEWVTANFDALMKRLPPAFASGMAGIAAGCEPERVARAREFFTAKKIPGVERRLEQVEEQVSQCAALKAREMRAVSEFLASRK